MCLSSILYLICDVHSIYIYICIWVVLILGLMYESSIKYIECILCFTIMLCVVNGLYARM